MWKVPRFRLLVLVSLLPGEKGLPHPPTQSLRNSEEGVRTYYVRARMFVVCERQESAASAEE